MSYTIKGTVAPGYEAVKELFEENFRLGSEENSQVCAYVKGERVVDLWGSMDPESKYDGDSLTTVWSSTKSLTAIVMAMAKDRGLLDYSDKISKYWPEFAAEGKEDIKIEDLMRHEAGLAKMKGIKLEALLTENIKKNEAGEHFAKLVPKWPEHKREYHALSRGSIANEIFRRVESNGKTIGEFLNEEVASKLQADVYIGCDKSNYFDVSFLPTSTGVMESIKKTFGMKSGVEISFGEFCSTMMYTVKQFREMRGQPDIVGFNDPLQFNTEAYRKVEMPSANGNCSARGLALVGAVMANKGELNGTRLMSEETWTEMHSEPTKRTTMLDIDIPFTKGGVAKYEKEREGWYGWFGYGGSVFQWHPEQKIGFSYTCTKLFGLSVMNLKAAALQQKVCECAAKAS